MSLAGHSRSRSNPKGRTHGTLAFDRGMALFGERRMVELVAAVGFYVMVAMTLNVFDVPVPGDEKPLQ
jgi:hypothetical protein